jgi:hypothetical protein
LKPAGGDDFSDLLINFAPATNLGVTPGAGAASNALPTKDFGADEWPGP